MLDFYLILLEGEIWQVAIIELPATNVHSIHTEDQATQSDSDTLHWSGLHSVKEIGHAALHWSALLDSRRLLTPFELKFSQESISTSTHIWQLQDSKNSNLNLTVIDMMLFGQNVI